jgi:hypothetical protein
MKHKFFLFKIITVFSFVISMAGCSKDGSSPSNYSGSSQQPQQLDSRILNLVTDNWQQQGSEPVYVNTFKGLMSNQIGSVQVYLETGGKETLISLGRVGFDDGEIWSQVVGEDLQIVYRDFLQEPGSAPGIMNIKVVFN